MKVTIRLENGHEIRIEKDYVRPNQLSDLIRKELSKYLDEYTREIIQQSKQEFFKRRES